MLYKALRANNLSPYGGFDYKPYLPTLGPRGLWVPGQWTPPIEGPLDLKTQGWFVSDGPGFVGWVHERNYMAQVRSGIVCDERQVSARQIRLLRPLPFTEVHAREYSLFCIGLALEQVPHWWGDSRIAELHRQLYDGHPALDVARHAARTVLEISEEWRGFDWRWERTLRQSMWEKLMGYFYLSAEATAAIEAWAA